MSDLDKEIKIELPAVPEKTLTCAFFDEEAGDWEALTCADEHASDSHVTCCSNHLTRFALVPAEYLEIVQEVKEGRDKNSDGSENVNVSLSDSGRGLNVKYLIGCVCAFFTLVATLFCLGK